MPHVTPGNASSTASGLVTTNAQTFAGEKTFAAKVLCQAGIGVGNSAAATTLGSVVRKIEVFDATGASIGFLPVYGAIT